MQLPDDNFYVEDLICNESFQQYCLGSSLEDQLLWQEWIENRPTRRSDFEEAKRVVNILNVKQGSRSAQLKALQAGIAEVASFKENSLFKTELPEAVLKVRKTTLYTYIGAIAAILLAAAFVYFYFNPASDKELLKTDLSGNYASGKALRKTVVLQDGSVVILAKESAIRLEEGFSKTKRALWLSGEAFFDVKHDAAHPFVVHTPFNDIKVLGTTFNVKAYPDLQLMETALIQGVVRVESKKYPGYFVVLKPNEKLLSSNAPEKVSMALIKKEYLLSTMKRNTGTVPAEIQWVRKRLDIDNLPLSVIAQKLQDWYGIEILIKDEQVKNYRYSGIFENETILKTLEALQLSYPFQFSAEGDKIVIKK